MSYTDSDETDIYDQDKMTTNDLQKPTQPRFNGFIGDFKQYRELSDSSDDDIVSIEETYKEVNNYKPSPR
jgi:hypothetical protein